MCELIYCTTTIRVFHPDMFTCMVSIFHDRPLDGVYQALSFNAAYFHTVPSMHLGNMATVYPAMIVKPDRSFEAFALQ